MSNPAFIKPVGDECQLSPLNFSDTVLHSVTRHFARDEEDSGLSIKFVVSGQERYKIGQQWHVIQGGRFLIVNPGQQFQCRVDSRKDVEGLCLYLDPKRVAQMTETWRKGHEGMLDMGQETCGELPLFMEKLYSLEENQLGTYLKSMVPVLRDPLARSEMDGELFFDELASALLNSQGENDRLLARLDQERTSTKKEIYRRVSLAKQFIDDHFLDEIRLDEVAAAAHFSKYHFLRCFKQVYGQAPYQYVMMRRLEAARTQLRFTKRTLSEIAQETGFGDRRAFNKAFRKAFGINPAELRD